MSPEGIGLCLALGAGLCTSIGGAFVFFVSACRRLPLAISLALSSGVMLYVSLVDIFREALLNVNEGFAKQDGGKQSPHALLVVSGCFFLGWILADFIDSIVHFLIRRWHLEVHVAPATIIPPVSLSLPVEGATIETASARADSTKHSSNDARPASQFTGKLDDNSRPYARHMGHQSRLRHTVPTVERNCWSLPPPEECLSVASHLESCFDAPSSCWLAHAYKSEGPITAPSIMRRDTTFETECSSQSIQGKPALRFRRLVSCCCNKSSRRLEDVDMFEMQLADERFRRDATRFLKIGFATAITLGFHNFPEGVATYTGALASNSKTGVAVAVAIGIHNVPEGFAVSVPLFFGTQRRWYAFMLSVFTGMAEPLGALGAWFFLSGDSSSVVLGIAFAAVAGIMTNVALKELLPTAIKYDPCDEVTSRSFLAGMFFMAASLVVIQYT